MKNLFTDHPKKINTTYFGHMKVAFSFAFPMIGAALAGIVHGLFPFMFEYTMSNCIKRSYERFKAFHSINKESPIGDD